MTATELLNQIRQEIERRINGNKNQIVSCSDSWMRLEGEMDCLIEILSFIDTLQVDEPEGLDEAAKQCQEELYDGYYSGHQKGYQVAFKAGAEWHKEKLMEWARECKAKIDKNFFNNPNYELATKRLMFDVFIDKLNSM